MKSYFIFYQINRFLSSKQSNLIILVKLTIHNEKKKEFVIMNGNNKMQI